MNRNEIECHKRCIIEELSSRKDAYKYKQTIEDILCNAADGLPRVGGAGEFFEGEGQSYVLMYNGVKLLPESFEEERFFPLIRGLRGHYEPFEEKIFHEILETLPKAATMIEVGSGLSYYSLSFANRIERPSNYMIEPDPVRLEVGRRNFVLNGKQGLFVQAFIDSFFQERVGLGIKKISLDAFLEENKITHVHLLHADVQFHEAGVLGAAKAAIRDKRIDYILLATHAKVLHEQCARYLKMNGYTSIAEKRWVNCRDWDEAEEDGFLVAKRNGVPGPDWIAGSEVKHIRRGNNYKQAAIGPAFTSFISPAER